MTLNDQTLSLSAWRGHNARGVVTAVTGDVEETDPGDLEVITNAIKQVGINAGSTLVGVAAADAFNEYVPEAVSYTHLRAHET